MIGMAKEFKNGQMVHFMMVIGKIIKLMEKVSFTIQMVSFTKVNGRTTELMDMVY